MAIIMNSTKILFFVTQDKESPRLNSHKPRPLSSKDQTLNFTSHSSKRAEKSKSPPQSPRREKRKPKTKSQPAITKAQTQHTNKNGIQQLHSPRLPRSHPRFHLGPPQSRLPRRDDARLHRRQAAERLAPDRGRGAGRPGGEVRGPQGEGGRREVHVYREYV